MKMELQHSLLSNDVDTKYTSIRHGYTLDESPLRTADPAADLDQQSYK